MNRLFLTPVKVLVALLLILPLIFACDPDEPDGAAGVRLGLALEGLPQSPEFIRKLEQDTGLPVSLVNFFLQWPQDPGFDNFPGQTLHAVLSLGALPVLTWEPMYYEDHREHMIPAAVILEGGYDEYITLFARRISELDGHVIIRFAHEMNLSRYHWGGTLDEYGPESPERYIRMFRHVVEIFREKGVQNALFAFCPNNESLPNPKFHPGAEWNDAENYYPGDEFVDVLGMDGYNWGTTRTMNEHGWNSKWLSFREIFQDIYHQLRGINPDMPLYVFETASVRQGGDRSRWIRDAFYTAAGWGMDGVVWFHVDKEEDWTLDGFRDSRYFAETREMIVRE